MSEQSQRWQAELKAAAWTESERIARARRLARRPLYALYCALCGLVQPTWCPDHHTELHLVRAGAS